jgi:hypothetical protein
MFSVFWTFWLAACAILWLAAARDFWSALLCFALTVPQTVLLWRRCARLQGAPPVRRTIDK